MKQAKDLYRRHLPHYQPPGGTFFVTFRLAGSLPSEVTIRLKEEHAQLEKHFQKIRDLNKHREKLIAEQKKYFRKFDHLLDRSSTGPSWLRDDQIAKLVADAIHHRDGKAYDLLAYCIMPNHVHLVVTVKESVGRRGSSPYILSNILENLKWYTALKANKIRHRSGEFWQHESHDHLIRDGGELRRVVSYVLGNPAKAGLVEDWRDWRWSYARKDLLI